MRVDGAAPRGLWPPAGGRLCRRVVKGTVLKIDWPFGARGFLSLTALRAEGCGIALPGDEYKVSVTDLPFCVIRHDEHSADWPRRFPFPASQERGNAGMIHEVHAVQSLKSDSLRSMTSFGNTVPRPAVSPPIPQSPVSIPHSPFPIPRQSHFHYNKKTSYSCGGFS